MACSFGSQPLGNGPMLSEPVFCAAGPASFDTARSGSGDSFCRFLLVVSLCLSLHGAAAAVGGSGTNAAKAGLLPEQVRARLAEAQTLLNQWLAFQAGQTNAVPGATVAELTEYRFGSELLVRTYQQHLEELSRLESARERAADFERLDQGWQGFAGQAHYSILIVDDLRDQVETLSARVAAGEATRNLLVKLSAQNRETITGAEERMRQVSEQLETAKDASQIARLEWQNRLEILRSRLNSAQVMLNEARRQTLETDLNDYRQRLAMSQQKLAMAVQKVEFSREDLEQVLGNLDKERTRLEGELRVAEAERDRRQADLETARKELADLVAKPMDPGQTNRDSLLRRLQDSVELRAAQRETAGQRLFVARQLMEIAIGERGLWQMRFDTFDTRDFEKLHRGYGRLDQLANLVKVAKPHFAQQVELAAQQIAAQTRRAQGQLEGTAESGHAEDLLTTYRQREVSANLALQGLEGLERLTVRWKQSLDQSRKSLPLGGRVRDLFSEMPSFATKLWQFELFAAEDTIVVEGQSITGRRSVTVGKVAMAILILVVGYWMASLLARLLERVAVKRLKVEPNQASLVRRWTRVVLVIFLIVFSLVSVKIPLTIFAFLGGALAIGFGFGLQTLLKNFISGIIILFERPFRVGDVLDVNGRSGTVTGIGIRSSVLQLWDGTETLIPNSTLLENNLTNWTYSNRRVRFAVTVGVGYGSDTRLVSQLLSETAARHGLILTEPVPQVLFQEFGDNALTFELRYWVDVQKQNAAQIASDLRHMIAGAFAQHGISISYPQRDIHLDSAHPLQIEVIARKEKRSGAPESGQASKS